MTSTETKSDIYQDITDRIIAAIESGAGDFTMPWHRDAARTIPKNIASKNSYRGINILALWIAQTTRDYQSNLWGTYRQWQDHGAQVRRGEKATPVVFYKDVRREETSATGEIEVKRLLVAKASYVFNADQVEGYSALPSPALIDSTELLQAVEQLVRSTQANIEHGGDRALYRLDTDTIHLPPRERFFATATSSATDAYYSTLLHELTHWTGAACRLNRDLANRFGSEAYAMEELIAELGAAFLCADLGISVQPRPDHAAYVSNWLAVLQSDKRAVFTAASQSSRAVDFLNQFQLSEEAVV